MRLIDADAFIKRLSENAETPFDKALVMLLTDALKEEPTVSMEQKETITNGK